MKEKIQNVPIPVFPKPQKMKGHTKIILTDKKTGKQEVYEDDNMVTNALSKMFENCGLMNYPNADRDNYIPQLLGGIMGFDTALTEDPDNIYTPAGVEMIFNGSTLNTTDAGYSELGIYMADESGWNADHTAYTFVYEFMTTRGNCKTGHPISCVCLTGREYGLAGEGNSVSEQTRSSKVNITTLQGTQTTWSGYAGYVFKIDFTNSCCYALDLSERAVSGTEGKVTLRKYNVPINELRIDCTSSSPALLEETVISLASDSDFINSTSVLLAQQCNDKLIVWDMPTRNDSSYYVENRRWGSEFTQHLWIFNADGTYTKKTVPNNTGASNLSGIGAAYFLGDKWCIFPKVYSPQSPNYAYYQERTDSRVIYLWNRTDDTMTQLSNPYGAECVNLANITHNNIDYWNNVWGIPWNMYHGVDGKAYIFKASTGDTSLAHVIDCENETIYPTNFYNVSTSSRYPVTGAITTTRGGVNLLRDQCYIATINNLQTPIMKDASKTMRVIYTITFEPEEEGTSTSN